MFQSDLDWQAIAQYNISLVLWLCGKYSEAVKVRTYS
jgi:hypothetical protein